MELVLLLLLLGVLWDALLFAPLSWQQPAIRRVITGVAIGYLCFVSAISFSVIPLGGAVVLLAIAKYRLYNYVRIFEGRMHTQYLRSQTARTATYLFAAQLVVLGIAAVDVSWTIWAMLCALVACGAGAILLASSIRRLKHTHFVLKKRPIASADLPTVTLAIPARNETDDLEACIRTALQSTYPKLEVLVLDDCSQLKRTPEIIRDFAHKGVRFLQGTVPEDDWLAKNFAYHQLTQSATGQIIIFAGVDIRWHIETVDSIVQAMLSRKKRMLSVLPLRDTLAGQKPGNTVVQAARYFWELAPPRRLFRRPPIMSSCWAMYSHDLRNYGGFAAVKRAIIPEAYFAKQAIKHGDSYSFLRASRDHLPVFSAKSGTEQRETAIRVRYPSLHKRPEIVLLVSGFGLVAFIAPLGILLLASVTQTMLWPAMLAAIGFIMQSAAYTIITRATAIHTPRRAPFLFLPAVITDIILMHVSMHRYEFSDVVWKGRNICIPAMHVVPSLPKLPEDSGTSPRK